jgi:ABC-type transport system involved in cytochrome bd biosynthesis fused ATPase/permease subunit
MDYQPQWNNNSKKMTLIMRRPMPWPHQGLFVPFWPHKRESMHELGTLNVTNFTLQHMGSVLLDETEVVLKHGNRCGLIGSNGCGKPTFLLKALGAWAIPILNLTDIFTAMDAVMNVDEERLRLETHAEQLNQLFGGITDNLPNQDEEQSLTWSISVHV